jgi:hypothetical protein
MALTSSTVRAVTLAAVVAGIILGPSAVVAGSGHGGRGGGKSIGHGSPHGARSGVGQHPQRFNAINQHAVPHRPVFPHERFDPRVTVPRDLVDRKFGHHGFGHAPFRHRQGVVTSFVPFVSPAVIVAPVEPVVVAPPVSAMAVPPVVAAPPAPPMPTVVQYPHGRYELRGDGVTTPYVWVWIPNPPSAPPPPQAPPPPASQESPSPESDGSTRSTAFYCFTDNRGVTLWTDQLQRIPEQYRAAARRAAEGTASPRCVAAG